MIRGATKQTLQRRVRYGGRKGRSAARRLSRWLNNVSVFVDGVFLCTGAATWTGNPRPSPVDPTVFRGYATMIVEVEPAEDGGEES